MIPTMQGNDGLDPRLNKVKGRIYEYWKLVQKFTDSIIQTSKDTKT